MNHLLTVNQMARVLDLREERLQVLVPALQYLLGARLLLLEADDPLQPVDLGGDTLVNHHVADLLLSTVLRNADQIGKCGDANARVVLLDHADVVLDQLPDELTQMQHTVLG